MPGKVTVMVIHDMGTQMFSVGVFEDNDMLFRHHERTDELSWEERWELRQFAERIQLDAHDLMMSDDPPTCRPVSMGFALTWEPNYA